MKRSSLSLLFVTLVACGASRAPSPATPPRPLGSASLAPTAPAASEEDAFVPIFADDATWGARLAPVTIVAFEDFQCPFCARGADTLAKVQSEYGADKVRVVFKNLPLPFHPNARPAAEAATGVRALGGNDAFWRFYTSAFAAQKELGPDSYAKWAQAAGVDGAAIVKGSPAWSARVSRDVELAKKLGIDGTPTFLVNGELVSGAQPIEVFEQAVNQELAKAKTLMEGGLSPDRVYAKMTEANLKDQAATASKEKEDEDRPDPNVYKVPAGKSPVLGDRNALVTIIEFSDFQCPYCKEVEGTLAQVRARYGKDVRIVWKNDPLPFHPRAEPAAELAMEARAEKGDAGFWAAHDALFASQSQLEDADLESVARDLKLDVAKVKAAIATHKYETAIDDDTLLADSFRAEGTPHFFIDGRRLRGAEPLAAFTVIIDEELGKARALAAKGTAPASMYEALTRDGVAPAEPEKHDVAAAGADAPMRGAAKAKVVVQEFADFQCPYCEHAEAAIDQLVKIYGTKVKVVWRNLPLPPSMHPDAELAAEAALEAQAQKGQAAFWKMHDLLFANQKIDGALQRPALDGYARQLGLDMTRWAAALDGHTHQAAIEADQKVAEAAGVNGTPSFFVNGYVLTGAQPYAKIRQLVDRALDEASKPAAKPAASGPASPPR